MCLPSSDEKSRHGSTLPLIALMLGACLAGPALGRIAGGATVGVGVALLAFGACFAVPAGLRRLRRRHHRSGALE